MTQIVTKVGQRLALGLLTAVIYISHDLAVVAQMADRIMVLRHGNLVEEGTAEEIVNHPQQDHTQRLLAVRSQQKPTREPPPEEPLLRIEYHFHEMVRAALDSAAPYIG